MKKDKLEVVRGSGNIYRDFDKPDADIRQLKAILAAKFSRHSTSRASASGRRTA